jgi:hypothetical protein
MNIDMAALHAIEVDRGIPQGNSSTPSSRRC